MPLLYSTARAVIDSLFLMEVIDSLIIICKSKTKSAIDQQNDALL
jgi:hypothetical protein